MRFDLYRRFRHSSLGFALTSQNTRNRRGRLTPDVILLDLLLLLPEMDGPSFLEVIRSYLRLQALPVVVITGLADSPMVDHARFLKVNAILVKGKATPDEIIRALEEAIMRVPG